ncbi:uncharacterized protein LOC114518884 [Dendronephthya gigantea]|uniref:uncharacterized protein LOC114518884 n=1 Tax=Dendronephthya gigantea TaxID=151771 RepID=UPI00106CAC9F|nr:uncharacterized protein LOC114518884 [Dendronephthya gigantea]
MLFSFRQCLVWLFGTCRSLLFCRKRKFILLAFLGICFVVLSFTGSKTFRDDSLSKIRKRSAKPYHGKRVHISAQEVLNFPGDYHAKGVLSLPYGNIVEPFEAWYSAKHKMSRIDYYGGMDQTYQKELLGKHGFACKVVPEYSERTQKTYRGCLHRRGTKRFPVKAQSILPTSHYFKYVGDMALRGHNAAKWQHKFKVYSKVNTYILYTTKTKPVKPLRYEMMGYDTLLSSYYDHYVLDYEMIEPWDFNYTTLQIPTDLDCFDFSSKRFSNTVGELNPMVEYMPHTGNGAPFTLSHSTNDDDSSSQDEILWNHDEQESYYPYFNRDGTGRISNENVAGLNNIFAYSPPLYSSQDKRTQESDRRFSTNYVNSGKRAPLPRDKAFPMQENLEEYEDINSRRVTQQELPYVTGTKYDLGRAATSRKSVHKLFQTHKKRKEVPRFPAKENFNKNLVKHFYKSRKESKHTEIAYINTDRKHSRIQRIFNFKNVRRKVGRQKKKQKLHNRNKIGWKKTFVSRALRRNYEEIVNLLFDAFKLMHKKDYSSHHEHETRKDIYRHNLRFINSRNRMHLGYKLSSNHLMDMTDEELHKQKGLLQDEGENISNGGVPFEPLSNYFPPSVDWRKQGAVNSVKSQGICGSCYAYAVTGALEGAFFLKNGYLPDFSEQEIIDCSWGFGNRGCKGGYPHRAMQWILKHGGLAIEDNYGKYLAQEGYCHFRNVSIGVRIDSYMNITRGNVTELKQAISQYGPVSVLINTQPKSFKFYSSGIYYDPECSGNNLDHAALLVGYGEERGIPYWLIKNSWSKAWGESGYIKIAQRNNNCGVTSKAVVVRIR